MYYNKQVSGSLYINNLVIFCHSPSRNYSTNTSFEVITELCYKVSPPGHVPSHIKQPPYAISGVPPVVPRSIEIKTDEQIAAMRTACRTARKVLNVARDNVKVRLDFTTVKMVPQEGDFYMKRMEGSHCTLWGVKKWFCYLGCSVLKRP